MIPLLERLKNNEILISDGAMGTMLQAAGLEAGLAPEEWNISNPEAVKKIHSSFISAGSDMITTNTFGANPIKLKRPGLEEKLEEINKAGVKIAKDAANASAYVLGDIGPTGEFLKPIGAYDKKQFYDSYFKQAAILYKSGVDAYILETMSGLDELKIAVSACKSVGSLPVIASMSFTATDKGYKTMMGVSPEQAVTEMLSAGCDIIGANCGCGIRQMIEIMCQMRKAVSKSVFLIAQPNAGMPKLINNETIFSETPQDFAKATPDLIKSGVNIIGGCCGTTPEHIKAIVKALRLSL